MKQLIALLTMIAFSCMVSGQQFEIRLGSTVFNDGDTIVYIPTESNIRDDGAQILFKLHNTGESNVVLRALFNENYPVSSIIWGWACLLPTQQLWPLTIAPGDSANCGIDFSLSQLTYPPTSFFDISVWDTNDISSSKTIHVFPYDTNIYPIYDFNTWRGTQELCMVSVQNGYNTLNWEKEGEVSAYKIYRESTVANVFEHVATIPYDSASIWIDSVSRPTTRSYRYNINAQYLDGVDSPLGEVHKTMHLTISQGVGGRWNLQWTPYEGAEYSTYIIYRGTNAEDMEQIDIMPADGNTSYTDEESPSGDVYYQVGIVMSNPCSEAPSAVSAKSTSISRSNIATNSSVGINSNDYDGINVYSRDGRIIVDGTNGESIAVYDMFGRNVGDCSQAFPTGVYMVKISNYPARKVVVVR